MNTGPWRHENQNCIYGQDLEEQRIIIGAGLEAGPCRQCFGISLRTRLFTTTTTLSHHSISAALDGVGEGLGLAFVGFGMT